MDNHVDDCPWVFGENHFLSEYERYAALMLAGIRRLGRAAVIRTFADADCRALLDLPA